MLNAHRPPTDPPADPPTDPPDASAATITETVALPGRNGYILTNASWGGRVIGVCESLGVQCIADDRDTVIAMLRAACQLRVDAIGQFVRAEYRDAGGELPEDSSPTWDWPKCVTVTAPERGLQTLVIDMLRQIEARRPFAAPDLMERMIADPSSARLAPLVRLANALGCEWRCELVPKTDAQTPSDAPPPANQPPSP